MFRFLRVAGNGINGYVCLGESKKSYEKYAIKMLDSLSNELEVCKKLKELQHKNIIYIHDFIRLFDIDYVLMEAMDLSVFAYMKKKTLLPEEVKWIFHELMCGLNYCHQLNILHRDVKPANILLKASGEVKLCDFSLSKENVVDPMTTPVVTLWYRSPELLIGSNNYNFSIDTWAACCTFLEMLYGHPPFVGSQNTEISTLFSIFNTIGKPLKDDMIFGDDVVYESLPSQNLNLWIDLSFIIKTFVYNICKRPSSSEILKMLGSCEPKKFNIECLSRCNIYDSPPKGWEGVF